uniref:Uncharacterized protein n=1 Tax=Plectus sambesii TaxID=2011161 RepID=A0A914UT31_9BILA
MLLRLIAVSLVMMACASEVLGATFNCTATEENIFGCLYKPEQNKSLAEYTGQIFIFNMPAVTSLLKKLQTSGCIKTSAWKDIQTWIKLNTPPKPISAVYKGLTKDQKTSLQNGMSNMNDQESMAKMVAVMGILQKKFDKFTKADGKKIDNWVKKGEKACPAGGVRITGGTLTRTES